MSGYYLHNDTQNENYKVPEAVYIKFRQQQVEIEYLRIAINNACKDIGHAIQSFDKSGQIDASRLALIYVDDAKKELTRRVSK